MKYNINIESNGFDMQEDCSDILSTTIDYVAKKIHVDCSGITWFIFDEDFYKFPNFSPVIYYPRLKGIPHNYRYGLCNIKEKKIYVSKQAIMAQPFSANKLENPILKLLGANSTILLIDVLIDEIAHITTGKDHGDPEYDNMLANYYKLCYT